MDDRSVAVITHRPDWWQTLHSHLLGCDRVNLSPPRASHFNSRLPKLNRLATIGVILYDYATNKRYSLFHRDQRNMSPGAWVGITIGALAFLLALGYIIHRYYRRKQPLSLHTPDPVITDLGVENDAEFEQHLERIRRGQVKSFPAK